MPKPKEYREESWKQQGQPGPQGQQGQQGQQGPYGQTRQYGQQGQYDQPAGRSFSPAAVINRLADEMDRLFDDIGLGRGSYSSRGRGQTQPSMWTPQVEVFERGGQLVIRADLPGLKKEDVKVDISDDALTIQGERRQEYEENRESWHRSERNYGLFFRRIPLPDGIDVEQANARFNDGVLEVVMPLPLREEQRTRRLEIT